MKKPLVLLLTFLVVISCVSCGDKPSDGKTGSSSGASSGSSSGSPSSGNPSESKGTVYAIADYYNDDGTFSDLGLALNEENSERVLTVQADDVLVVGGRQYTITAESITVPFYTQPSYDEVIEWWAAYLKSHAADGIVEGEFEDTNLNSWQQTWV